jgi:hypothetical protein
MKGSTLGVVAVVAVAMLGEACRSTPAPPVTAGEGGACGASFAAHADGATWAPAPDDARPVSATFTATIDP